MMLKIFGQKKLQMNFSKPISIIQTDSKFTIC